MSEAPLDRGGDGELHATRALKRIADTLGLPKTAFYDGSTEQVDLNDTSEMLRIWDGLRHRADRLKVLAFARAVAAESADAPKR